MEAEMTKPRRMASTNLGLFLASTVLLFARILPLASAVCEDLEATCEDDDVCLGCLTYTQATEYTSLTECRERYPGIWSIGGEGYTAAFCESKGGLYCCDFEDNAAAETCMNNTAAASYWSCLMDDAGCEVEEMPCYSGADISPVATTPTPAPAAPTNEPSSSSSLPSSSSAITPSSTSSSSTSTIPKCDAEIAECENDETCLECTASTSVTHDGYTAECKSLYPDSFIYYSENGSYRYCDAQGAYFCCEFETEVFATTCMQNDATASYWGCLLTDIGCSVEDMPCYSGVPVNPGDSYSLSSSGGQDPPPRPSNTPAPVSTPSTPGTDSAPTPAPGIVGATTPAPMSSSASTPGGQDPPPPPASASNTPAPVSTSPSSGTDSAATTTAPMVVVATTTPSSSGTDSAATTTAPMVVATTTPAPMSSSEGSNDRGLEITASPTVADTGDSSAAGSDASAAPTDAGGAAVDADTNANAAARVGAPSSAVVLGFAAWLLAAAV